MKLRLSLFWPFLLVFLLAAVVRVAWLGQYPSGLHFDEAWFGYNAFLLKERGTNIYNERWPIDVDVFGEHVSAAQAYWTIPFISVFGLNAFAIRLTVVTFSLLTLLLAIWFLYRLTQNRTIALVFAILYAVSPLNIVMARASSTVIIDTFFLLSFLVALTEWLRRTSARQLSSPQSWLGLALIYGLSVIAYFTYFTSRLLIPAFGIITLGYFAMQKTNRPKLLLGALPIVLYLLVPFLLLLSTPFGRGRFDQTTIINNQNVQFDLTNSILRFGQAGAPPLLTRALHNKLSDNARAFLQQYVTFWSPNPALFSLKLPARYRMPSLGPIAPLEYFGLILAAAAAVLVVKKSEKWRWVAGWLVLLVGTAIIPSALTVDDFPNWQRAAAITPFLQMAAAVGLAVLTQSWYKNWAKWLPVLVLLFSLPVVISLTENYTTHARFFEPFYRDVAGWRLGEWINANAHDERLLLPSVGVFLFPYFQDQSLIPDLITSTSEKNLIQADTFQIGPRHFVRELCGSPLVLTENYDYLILKAESYCQQFPWWVEPVTTITWENGTAAFFIGRAGPEKETLRQTWEKITGDTERNALIQQIFGEEPPRSN